MCNLGFLAEFLGFYFTLYSPRSGPCTIWEFWRVIWVYFILCSTLSGLAKFGVFGGVFRVLFHFIWSSERAAHNLGFLR